VYRRSDGTLAVFASPSDIVWLAAGAGLRVADMRVIRRRIANRAEGLVFKRRWVQMMAVKDCLTPALP